MGRIMVTIGLSLYISIFMLILQSNVASSIQLSHKPIRLQSLSKFPDVHFEPHPVSMQAMAGSSAINKAAFKSIAKLISTCSIGVMAAKLNILNADAISVLSKLIFNLFQPCLLFVSVSNTVAKMQTTVGTGSNAIAMYLLPGAALFSILTGYIVGKILSLIIYGVKGCESENAKQLLICTTFANAGPLPLVFTDGLFATHSDKTMLSKSVAYISLYLLGTTPSFWIFGPQILAEKPTIAEKAGTKAAKLVIGTRLTQVLLTAQRVLSPPVVASMLGMLVGFVPLLRTVFTASDGLLNPVYEAMKTLGTAYLPCVLLVLAGSLSSSISIGSGAKNAKSTSPLDQITSMITKENGDFAVQVLSIYLARFLLMPLMGFALLKLAVKHIPGTTSLFVGDPMLLFILLLQLCMPSAQNSTVVYQLMGKKDAAGKLAKILMFLYIAGVPAITYCLMQSKMTESSTVTYIPKTENRFTFQLLLEVTDYTSFSSDDEVLPPLGEFSTTTRMTVEMHRCTNALFSEEDLNECLNMLISEDDDVITSPDTSSDSESSSSESGYISWCSAAEGKVQKSISDTTLSSVATITTTKSVAVKLPKILKRDFRRSYMDMLGNVANNWDMALTESFFTTFATPDFVYIQDDGDRKFNSFQVAGRHTFLQYWFNRIHYVPDAIMTLSESQIETTIGVSGSEMHCKFAYSGTVIYALPFSTILPAADQAAQHMDNKHKRKMLPLANDATQETPEYKYEKHKNLVYRCSDTLSRDFSNAHLYDTTVLDIINRAPLLPNPQTLVYTGYVTFFLDDNKMLTKLAFHSGMKYDKVKAVETSLVR